MLKTISSITNALGALNYKGTWNASSNTPTLADGTGAKGDYYVVSTAGTQTFGGVQLFFGTGDWIAYNGAVWQRVEGGSDGNFANVTLTSTDAGATAAPLLDLYRDSASPAASDTLGEIEFNGEDSAGNKQTYGVIHGSILSPTSTAEQGQLHFETATAGALTEKMIIGTTNLVVNDIGAVFNVRIEGDTDANLFYTDATNDRIGVGTISPTKKLDVVGTVGISSTTTLSGLTASTALALDASKNIVSVTNTGTGSNVLATSPSLVTPALGAATATSLASSGEISTTNVGAAVTSFSAQCSAGDQSATSLKLTSSRTDVFYHIQAFTSGTSEQFRVEANGNVKNTNSSYGSLSDIKIKENVVDATPKLDDLMKVRIRNYNIIGETTKQIGVVAQELEEIFPGMVDETQDRDVDGEFLGTTTKGVKYSVFVPILVKAIQELKAEFDAYKASHP